MVDSSQMQAAFTQAVVRAGRDYVAARNALLEQGAGLLPFYEQQLSANDWPTGLTAAILIGWLRERDRFDQCTEAVRGKLFGPRPIHGRFPSNRRIAVIEGLGKVVTPRLLEMALKTKEIADDGEQLATVFGALVVLKDARAVVPLIDTLASPSTDAWLREWAASTLGPMHDARAVAPLVAVLRSPASSDMLRASAAMSLGALEAREALPDLRAIALDAAADLSLRKAALGALSALRDSASAEPLLHALPRTADLPFQLYLVTVVGDIGAAAVVPALRQIESKHPEEALRKYAREARLKIQERAEVR